MNDNLLQSAGRLPRLRSLPLAAALALAACCAASAQTPIGADELMPPAIRFVGAEVEISVKQSVVGRRYQLQQSDTLAPGSWVDVETERLGNGGPLVIATPRPVGVLKQFYRLALDPVSAVPAGFALIPGGSFLMGDQSDPPVGTADERPVHEVIVGAFYLAKYEVTKELWDEVRGWGQDHGYTDLPAGGGKAANHPVHSINWHAVVKWCNARSQKEGLTPCYTVDGAIYKTLNKDNVVCDWGANGYRLPTEAEWEKAARGGAVGKNFPWGTDTISHSQANYYSSTGYSYDVSPTRGYHPTYATGLPPYSSPVGSLAANGYGIYDMAGNMWEWCWDWHAAYTADAQTNPRGPASGSLRLIRGGNWSIQAEYARCADRYLIMPDGAGNNLGFRLARSHL